jgi:membrane associated rhomboid family serine protease
MTNITAIWHLNPTAITRGLRAAWIACTAVVILFIYLILAAKKTATPQFFFFATTGLLYIMACRRLLRAYTSQRASDRSIIVLDGALTIPRSILSDHRIKLSEIKSIERYENSKETLGILIGRRDKSSILVEQANFNSANDFEELYSILSQVVTKNRLENREYLSYLTNTKDPTRGHLSTAAISLIFLAIYIMYSSPGAIGISQQAIVNGALTKDVISKGELYRFASSFFLHYSPYHLGFNVLSLAIVGRHIDAIFGTSRFAVILLTSAVIGALTSWIFSPFSFVIGASGGILGLFGAYFVVCMTHQNRLPGSVSLSPRLVSIVLFAQILLDLTMPEVDISSHIGGFLSGSLYAILLLRRQNLISEADTTRAEKYAAIVISLIFASGILHFIEKNSPF